MTSIIAAISTAAGTGATTAGRRHRPPHTHAVSDVGVAADTLGTTPRTRRRLPYLDIDECLLCE
jgi:hypothetical protein